MKYLRTDRETVLIVCKTDLLPIGFIMERTGTDCHALVIERNVRTIKDYQRATLASLPYKLPLALYPYLFRRSPIHVLLENRLLVAYLKVFFLSIPPELTVWCCAHRQRYAQR